MRETICPSVNTASQTQGVVALYLREVPDDVQFEAEIEATRAGESMEALVLDAVRHEVDRRRAERGEPPVEWSE
jgi:hypothetical protein